MQEIYVKVLDLPGPLQSALQRIGYRKIDVGVRQKTHENLRSGAGKGKRGITMLVDLESGRIRDFTGSWGGANPFESSPVDLDDGSYPLPSNGAVIHAVEGGNSPTHADITVHPDAVLPALEKPSDLSDKDRAVLFAYRSLKSGARHEELQRRGGLRKIEIFEAERNLVHRGLLKENRAGSKRITTDGKNAISDIGIGTMMPRVR